MLKQTIGLIISFSIIAGNAPTNSAFAQDVIKFRTTGQFLRCLKENAGQITSVDKSQYWFSVEECPQLIDNVIGRFTQNVDPTLDPKLSENEKKLDNVIVLEKNFFSCIQDFEIDDENKIYEISFGSCDITELSLVQ